MACFDVVHLREQDVDMIIVIVGVAFGEKAKADQERILEALQVCAAHEGWLGTVVPVWEAQSKRLGFLAPPDWHGYFARLSFEDITKNVNRKLYCG